MAQGLAPAGGAPRLFGAGLFAPPANPQLTASSVQANAQYQPASYGPAAPSFINNLSYASSRPPTQDQLRTDESSDLVSDPSVDGGDPDVIRVGSEEEEEERERERRNRDREIFNERAFGKTPPLGSPAPRLLPPLGGDRTAPSAAPIPGAPPQSPSAPAPSQGAASAPPSAATGVPTPEAESSSRTSPPGFTPLGDLPPGSAGGENTGKRFSRSTRRRYPEGTRCIYCGRPTTSRPGLPNSRHLDHIIPSSQGGNSDPDNEGPACLTCNLQKGARTPAQWYHWLLQKLGLGE